ncbi:YcaO-like family protein [Mesorhizobium sp.]|uniref:YcaO-like family protein n=1 Tax=Mesorhizobium sp. TaxID=1871066 RepID=UPI000FE48B65|nr:YcaO-like family protein [Mesorhizobium sp.]RWP61506.1 MAG: hypothetical protein EOR07_22900 [Mesorhizobium sp.]
MVEGILDRLPITRLADITPLDCVGAPVFAAISPLASDLTTHLGKGPDRRSARISAIMEAVERVAAERIAAPSRCASFEQLRASGVNVADPLDFDLPPRTAYQANLEFEWVEAWDLYGSRPIWIAADLARTPPKQGILDHVDTNGLAAAATYAEALRHALLEVIERDAVSQHQFFDLFGDDGRVPPHKARIDPDSIPESCKRFVLSATEAGMDVVLEDLTSDLEIPVVGCMLVDRAFLTEHGPITHVFGGWGADPVTETALRRAVTEAFQSRVGVIQGARDTFNGLSATARPFTLSARRHLLCKAPMVPFSALRSKAFDDLESETDYILDRLGSVGIRQAIAVDMKRDDLGIAVVRVRVPGLSAFVADRHRVGWRCARHLL